MYNLGKPICESSWPKYDLSKTVDTNLNIGVQVNGKVRATINVTVDDNEDIIREKALKEENIIRHIDCKEIVKIIIIKDKIINIVVK